MQPTDFQDRFAEVTVLKLYFNLCWSFQNTMALFQELDSRINYVATKVIHLGDQLESVNIPRSRAAEAQKLMKYFKDFHISGTLLDDIFVDKSKVKQRFCKNSFFD